jgi:hypothetical protein
MTYDSTQDTKNHIARVYELCSTLAYALIKRGLEHDASKLCTPEKECFDKYSSLLKTLKFGSPEYNKSLEGLQVALKHHYKNNSHHPEHYPNGIEGMSLLDLVEMFCDWVAAGERTKDGSFEESVKVGSKRFNMDSQMKQIFLNTYEELKNDRY